ncbi:MAG TPA: SMC family ATPase [Gemmataceae bacterium]
MIPRRVCLRGFLCYREEQEIDFAGSTLWMLAGLNGSGKSAIFDAVTYALFGHHRGGSQHAAELINKDADGLQVEFDFALDGKLYRAKRTLKKTNRGTTTATQGIYRYLPPAAPGRPGKWEPVPDTGRKVEYDAWVRDRLGLTYETFTSSVLLLQGRAEKLLDSTAKGRFEVLAGIVDLDRYARLHARADDRRRELKAKHEALQHQLDALPDVTAEELAAADERIAATESSRAEAQAEVEWWQAAEYQARQWADLQAKAAALAQRWQQAQGLLAEAAAIERDAERARELTAVLPHLEAAVKQRGQIAESQRTAEGLAARHQAARERLAACEAASAQALQKRSALQKTTTADEQRQRDLQARLRRLEGVRAQVTMLEQQRRELERQDEELARLPADVEKRLAITQAEHDELASLTAAVPQLARLAQARDDLRQTRDRERRTAEQERAIKARGERLTAELATLVPQLEARGAERQRADDAASAARALLKQGRDEEKAFRELEGARVCRQCGQDLTPAHFSRELAQRQAEVKAAEAKVKETTTAQQAAQQAEGKLRQQVAGLEKERQEKREEYLDAKRQLEQAHRDADRHARDCAAVFGDLPEPFRGRVAPAPPADWLTTAYPTPADLDAARTRAARLDAVRSALRETQRQHVAWTALRGQVQTLRQGVAALAAGLPGEPEQLHRDFTRAEAEEQAVAGGLKAARAEARVVQEELDRLAAQRQEVEGELSSVAGQMQTEEVTRKHCRQSLDAALAALPDAWRGPAERAKLSELHGWKSERDALAERGVEPKAQELRQARAGLESLRQSKAELDRELEAFPEEARRPVAEVQQALRDSRGRTEACEETVRQTRQAKALLESRQRQRADLQAMALDVDRDHTRHALLAQLLGRDRLQLYLVRQAERQIVDHANAVLDRLSGGQLYLRLRSGEDGEEPDKALELEAYNRTTGGSAINVAFLSGSQRFRVAVSLALGIGQYASRQHRPIESVIIDEGFGCLDRNGRQVMIQELQNLRGHLHCILLVSHQEEFAEAFNDGYRFELTDGTTQVTRIQR